MSSRPVYIPSRKRSRAAAAPPQRLHGAFEGGFSAGYFNTVGSQEGWEPNNNNQNSAIRQQQKPEDYMDDQDFNEWGGPKTVRSEYQQETSEMALPTSQKSLLEAMVVVKPPMNIGRQLLRVLGWRDGSNAAYVPSHSETGLSTTITNAMITSTTNSAEDVNQNLSLLALSKKKLRKIQLQQKRVKIPPAKNDTGGLGFVPYEDAPEFRAARERRQRLARERALAAVKGSGRNVYRVSNLWTAGEDQQQLSQGDPQDDPYNSYETTEDFVGSKSVGGFALREDDDDVYDDNMLVERAAAPILDREQYDMVVYEHESDPDDDVNTANNATSKRANQNLSGLLSSWATGKSNDVKEDDPKKNLTSVTTATPTELTSDGLPRLAGFVIGTSSLPGATFQRYPGPTIPADYKVGRHVFTTDQMPSTLQIFSRAVQLEMMDERQRTALHDALEVNAAANAPARKRDSEKPMAGPTFSALAEAMKNRFRSSETQGASDGTPDVVKVSEERNKEDSRKKELKIMRTTVSFVPSSLLCKRFHVSVPTGAVAVADASTKNSEAAYFEREILNSVQGAHGAMATDIQEKDDDRKKASKKNTVKLDDESSNFEAEVKQRPSMEVYKSIYEPDEESSESEKDEDFATEEIDKLGDGHHRTNAERDKMAEVVEESTETTQSKLNGNGSDAPILDPTVKEETSLVPSEPTQKNRDRKRDLKEARPRSRSVSQDPSVSSDVRSSEDEQRRRKRPHKERHRERRRRDDRKKKRRKKESKSERKRDRKD